MPRDQQSCGETAQSDPSARNDRPRPREQEPAQEPGDETAEVGLLIDVGYEVSQNGHQDDDGNQASPERLEYRLRYRAAMNDQEGDERPKNSADRSGSADTDSKGRCRETRNRTPDAGGQIDDGERQIAVEPFDERPDDEQDSTYSWRDGSVRREGTPW